MRPVLLVAVILVGIACTAPPAPGDAGARDAPADAGSRTLADVVRDGEAERTATARPDFAALSARGPVTLEVRRAPDGSHVRRITHAAGWSVEEGPDEVFHDVAVHPSGVVSVAVEHTDRATGGYAIRRLDADGRLVREAPLEVSVAGDPEAAGLPSPPWRMRARPIEALEGGWVSVRARGEDLVVAFQSLVAGAADDVVLGLALLRDVDGALVVERGRLVDGPHLVQPAAWAYDELRWRDVLVRPLLAVDASDGAVIVGRGFTSGRCRELVRRFGERSMAECYERAAGSSESRAIPFVVTVFDAAGERLGSHVYLPERGYYFGVTAMDAADGAIGLGGAVAIENAEGALDRYPASPGAPAIMVPFDALLAVLERDGTVRLERRVGGDRADQLLAVRWVDGALVGVGAADWDRHDYGMSVSRGADPLLVHLAEDGTPTLRTFAEDLPHRHALFYDVALDGGVLRAVGAFDAPMTHSMDGGRVVEGTFGRLEVALR